MHCKATQLALTATNHRVPSSDEMKSVAMRLDEISDINSSRDQIDTTWQENCNQAFLNRFRQIEKMRQLEERKLYIKDSVEKIM